MSVFVFMFAIFFTWLTTFDFSFGAKAEQVREAYTPFEILGKDFAGIKNSLQSSAGEIKNLFNQVKNAK